MYLWNDHRPGDVTIEDTTFGGNEAYDGGAIHTGIAYFETLLTIRRTTFDGNWAYANSGGALMLYKTITKVFSSRFVDNSARLSTDGGAIKVVTGAKLEVVDTLFSGNRATRCGGAIYMELGTELQMVETTFDGNTAEISGGAVHLQPTAILVGRLSVFSDNSATLNGGALYTAGANANLTSTTFTRNSVSMRGSIYAEAQSDLYMLQCTVTQSSASTFGGGIQTSESGVKLFATEISGCTAASSGGAFTATARDTRPSVEIHDCEITGNTVVYNGGAVQTVNIALKLHGTEFGTNMDTAIQAWDVQGPCIASAACIQSPGFPAQYGELEECVITPTVGGTLSCPAFETERGWDFFEVGGIRYSGTGNEVLNYDPSQRPYCWDDGHQWNWRNLPCEQAFRKSQRMYDATPENTETCICQRGSSGEAPYFYDGPSTGSECAIVMCHRHPPEVNGEHLYQSCMFNGDADRQWDTTLPRCSGPSCVEGVNLSPGYTNVGTAALRASDPNIQEYTGDPALMCIGAPQLGCPAVAVTTSSSLSWASSGTVGAAGWEICLSPDDSSTALGESAGGSVHAVGGKLTIEDTRFDTATGTDLAAAQCDQALYVEAITEWRISDTECTDFSPATVYTIGMPLSTCNENPCAFGEQCSYTAYSLQCAACSENLVSDGIRCSACRPGTGPSADLSTCEACPLGKMSSDGVCINRPLGMIANDDQVGCRGCGLHLTASAPVDGSVPTCGCESFFYNSSDVRHVCFADGYDDQQMLEAGEEHESLLNAGQECASCIEDVLGDEYMSCEEGFIPGVRAGFTIPQLPSSRLRRLATADVVPVFRCHADIDIARERCPENAAPGQCAVGYSGYLCDSCDTDYGMSGSDKICQKCEDTGYTGGSLAIMLGIIVGISAFVFILSKLWTRFPLKHLARCAFQPCRILIKCE